MECDSPTLSLHCVTWWWHLEFKEACVPQLTTIFDWSMKIKSMQELKWGSGCVGSDIRWKKLCKDVRASEWAPSAVVLSLFHQDDDQALKSPRIIVSREFDETVLFKSSSKSDRKFSNSALAWLGDL